MSLEATVANPLGMKFPTRDVPFPRIPIFTFSFDGCEPNRFETFALVDIRSSNCNRLADAHYAEICFHTAFFQFFAKFFRRPGQHRKRRVVHRDCHLRPDQFYSISGADWSHREMVADANQHDVDLVMIGNARDVGKKPSVAGMVDGRAVANRDNQPGRHPGRDWRRIIIFARRRPVQGRNKTNLQLAAEQC